MANTLYDKAREAFISILLTENIVLVAHSSAYAANPATDQFLSSIPVGARVAVSDPLTGKSVTNGVFDAQDVTFPQMTGDPVTGFSLVMATGDDATSRLVVHWDTGVGIPFTPNGNDVVVVWDDGANKIFRV